MPAVRRCRSARAIRPANLPLRGPEDALGVLLATGSPELPAIVCLLLDEERLGLACLDFAGAAHADAVLDVAEVLLAAAEQQPGLAAVVIASFRPGESHLPEPGEECCFFELRDLFDDAGIDLVDWFLVADDYATSMAELTEARSGWTGRAGER